MLLEKKRWKIKRIRKRRIEMATTAEYIEYVCEQISGVGDIRI